MVLYNVHDLLEIDPDGLHMTGSIPAWAQQALQRFPWVVVRREAPSQPGFLPVGIRGPLRTQRHAIQLSKTAILERCTPTSLAISIHDGLRSSPMPSLAALAPLSDLLKNWQWGPGGSVAFQLATGMPCITTDSDLDLLLFPTSTLSRREAKDLFQKIRVIFGKADTLIETPEGAYALAEYAGISRTLLCRTPNGPHLRDHPDR